jgi:hypothetical protein
LKAVDNLKDSEFITNESMKYQHVIVPRSEIAKRIRADRKLMRKVAEFLGLDEEGLSATGLSGRADEA